ncbi:YebC/PmpR family DNA-binding transcriptional regulator [Alicyclobacillus vulcanalis]|uniref:Probable transcriptional regulatory protein SAMN05421799_11234 n=1 Tax=Alicyclobacillus vulcanalis TaxID=252246 RepID=A0A1N7P9J4_9BACL|nr:YebC/PmpR family DNA-binding transcriptional regulator [Alicyclobacillus vulcanalis]SIT07251.1 DNA-binding regulatory protein, YebC/PmpR family [Alicyclobacillus vulcanalis]
MAGHSKWHNIQRRKGKQDAIRGQLFTKLSKDIYQAAREGGGNPETNFRLRVAIERARANNLPMENIQRTIAKATGQLEGVTYEELLYEGYGPHGVALLIEILTDNRNRTAAEVRHLFRKHGGNLAESGAVAWMFHRYGRIVVPKEGVDADDLMMVALEAGADDVVERARTYVVKTSPESFRDVRLSLEQRGIPYEEASLSYEASTKMDLPESSLEQVYDLVEALESLDDVQTVYTNLDTGDEDDEGDE